MRDILSYANELKLEDYDDSLELEELDEDILEDIDYNRHIDICIELRHALKRGHLTSDFKEYIMGIYPDTLYFLNIDTDRFLHLNTEDFKNRLNHAISHDPFLVESAENLAGLTVLQKIYVAVTGGMFAATGSYLFNYIERNGQAIKEKTNSLINKERTRKKFLRESAYIDYKDLSVRKIAAPKYESLAQEVNLALKISNFKKDFMTKSIKINSEKDFHDEIDKINYQLKDYKYVYGFFIDQNRNGNYFINKAKISTRYKFSGKVKIAAELGYNEQAVKTLMINHKKLTKKFLDLKHDARKLETYGKSYDVSKIKPQHIKHVRKILNLQSQIYRELVRKTHKTINKNYRVLNQLLA